ncbi:oligosaccharide flippase family protein [Mangrovicoccus ximenensis]|uniref:oligosaccharide flippase family protein n=1 Tax=Mangrovicoccus ximenensis TaxID=1911570 RepID=UPI000D36A770|nr:oligosaccharide flippase family protein [Mangrovicoccus ximenensis]
MRRLHPWTPDPAVPPAPAGPFLSYGRAVLGTEVTKAAAAQADKLVVGALMGPEALGLYFMAFNAGLGLSTAFAQAFSTALFPHLCRAGDPAAALRRALGLSLAVIAPAVVLQALAAPYYVPLLFGSGWAGAEDIVSILCLAAIPTVLWQGTAQWLRARNRPQDELALTLVLAAALTANAALLAPHGVTAIAWGYLAVATVIQAGVALPVLAASFRPTTAKAI